jgi:hypothetical protein
MYVCMYVCRCSLTLRAKEGPKAVKAYSSHPAELVVDSTAAVQLGPHLSEVPFEYRPLQAGRRDILVNFVDASGMSVYVCVCMTGHLCQLE